MRTLGRNRSLAVLCITCSLAACSGEEPAPAPPAPARTAAPPAPNRIGAKQQKASEPRARPRTAKTSQQAAPRNVLPPDTDPQDVFLAYPEGRGNFAIVEDSDGSNPNDWFVAVAPAPGANSSSFSTILPRHSQPSGSRRGNAALPDGFVVDESAATTDDGWPQRVQCETDGSVMAFVPGGVFLAGAEDESENALPAHPVELDPYYIDLTEVTLGQYREFMDAMREEGRLVPPPANADAAANHPVLGVEWGEAIHYARWAGKSLPTEAEWELAARGPESYVCPWGNGRAVWDGRRTVAQIDPVGSFPTDESVFGVLDMAGNAKEWVFDLFGEEAGDGTTAVKNPTGPRRPSIPNHRVIKGGGPNWELWHRTSASMSSPSPDVGFRCVLRVSKSGNRIETRSLDGEPKAERPTRGGPRRRSPRSPRPGL